MNKEETSKQERMEDILSMGQYFQWVKIFLNALNNCVCGGGGLRYFSSSNW